MRILKNILSTILAQFIMFALVVSTTGFTFYTHNCAHHDMVKTIVSDKNSCCSSKEEVTKPEPARCCSTNQCSTIDDHSNCCNVEISYYRLSEWFTSVDTEKTQLVCKIINLKIDAQLASHEAEQSKIVYKIDSSPDPVPKLPKYLLFRQVKLEPPLI